MQLDAQKNYESKDLKLVPQRQEPPFLRNNWKRLLGSTDNWNLKYVRVINHVATVTNAYVILRARLAVEDGFYSIGNNNELERVRPRQYAIQPPFPDVETARPPFHRMKPFATFNNDDLRYIIQFVERARLEDDIVVIDSGGMFLQNNSADPGLKCAFPGIDEIFLRPSQLKLALVEMLRYDSVNFLKEDASPETPLVLGHAWDSCALLNPIRP